MNKSFFLFIFRPRWWKNLLLVHILPDSYGYIDKISYICIPTTKTLNNWARSINPRASFFAQGAEVPVPMNIARQRFEHVGFNYMDNLNADFEIKKYLPHNTVSPNNQDYMSTSYISLTKKQDLFYN